MSDTAPEPVPPAPAASSPSTLIGGGVGMSAAVIIVWAVETFAHVTVPGMIAAALGSLLSAGATYFHANRNPAVSK